MRAWAVRGSGQDQAGGLDSVHAGHADVHKDDIGMVGSGGGHDLASVGGLGHDLDARLPLQDEADYLLGGPVDAAARPLDVRPGGGIGSGRPGRGQAKAHAQ
jgi:hypothetical protein